MVWIIDSKINKVREVVLVSEDMMPAENVFLSEADAVARHKLVCKHPVELWNSKTRRGFCADCRLTL